MEREAHKSKYEFFNDKTLFALWQTVKLVSSQNPLMMHCGNNRPHRMTPQPRHSIAGIPVLQETSGSHYCYYMITDDHVNVHVEALVNKQLIYTHKHTVNLKQDLCSEHMLLQTDSWHTEVLHDKLGQDPLHSWEESNVRLRKKEKIFTTLIRHNIWALFYIAWAANTEVEQCEQMQYSHPTVCVHCHCSLNRPSIEPGSHTEWPWADKARKERYRWNVFRCEFS